jgi:non-ribosomal peptide synthetase component F
VLALLAAVMTAIHRLIEVHAATNGDALAIVDGDRSMSYRELNATANTLARRLMAAGFRRGMQTDVPMSPSADLAVLLLAILKAGGCYAWNEKEPDGRSSELLMSVGGIPLDVHCSPNLPVITRGTDIACVLEGGAGEPPIAVPHATVVSMASRPVGARSPWAGECGAFDLWIALMCGVTAVVSERQAVAA